MVKVIYPLFVLFLLTGSIATGQPVDLKFEHITSEDGLPQNTIHGIAKDKYGFMWFGTWSGLCRYDGYTFKTYHHDPNNPRSISNNRIHNILRDEKGNIWVMAFDDLVYSRYNYETDDFERVPKIKISKRFQSLMNRRNHLATARASYKGNVWTIDTRTNSLVRTNLASGTRVTVPADRTTRWALNDRYVTDLYMDDQHIIWVGTFGNGINKANLATKPFNNIHHTEGDNTSIADYNVRALSEGLRGEIWVGTRDKGVSMVRNGKAVLHLRHQDGNPGSLGSNQVKSIFCDSRGYVWIGTKTGLDGYDPTTRKLTHFSFQTPGDVMVPGIVEDNSGVLWFATWDGLYKSGSDHKLIRLDVSRTISSQHLWTILIDRQKRLWIGTEGGGMAAFKQVRPTSLEPLARFNHELDRNTISDNRVYALHEDRRGRIWIGTGNGLDRYDPVKRRFDRFPLSNDLSKVTIAAITEDKNGGLWVTHKTGVARVDGDSFRTLNYTMQDGLQSNEFSEGAAFRSRSGNRIYIGGVDGYNFFDPDSVRQQSSLPRVVLTELQILNKPVFINEELNGNVILKTPLYLASSIDLHYQDKSVAIEFAGLHYANPAGNKYAYMLEGFDKDWIYTDASHRVASYSNLSPGTYTFKVRAANSDGIWNPVPRTLQIKVHPAIWASLPAYAFYFFVFIGLLAAFYYYSIRYARLKSKLTYDAMLHQKDLDLQDNKLRFFTNISHEIKTPLSLILAPIDRVLSLTRGNTEVENQMQTMKSSGDRLLKLVNQLLDIRRLETGNEKLNPETRDIVSFVKETVEAFSEVAVQRNIKLRHAIDHEHFEFSFDEDKLEKVLYNLLSNAFRFVEQGGIVFVKVSIDPHLTNQVCIEVVDNGPGIAEQDLERIFLPFQQGSLNKAGGSGLGLAYSRSLVELHGGTLNVQSTTGGKNDNRTVFIIQIPIRQKETQEAPVENERQQTDTPIPIFESQDSAASVSPVSSLLIVEDNFELRRYLVDSFAGIYHVIEAENGDEGIKLAAAHTPDLVISDVMMPGMDGIEMTRRLKSDIVTSHIPVILLTARTLIEYQIEGLTIGADDYLVKPFNIELLLLKVRNMLLANERLKVKYKARLSLDPSIVNPESPDEKFLKKIVEYVEKRIDDSELNVEDLAGKVGVSRAQLYRKIRALTGFSVAEMVRHIRLKRAAQLLLDRKFQVSEITYMVGFEDPDYFRRVFKAEFGVSPTEYVKRESSGNGNMTS